jgi:hypothetical protein
MGKRASCLALVAVVAFGWQAAPAGKADEEVTARLVRQLGSRRYSEREAAARQLETLGAPALAALRRAVSTADLEVRRRAEVLIVRIEQRAEAARLLAGKRVRLIYKDTPLLEAIEDLAARTGFDLRIDEEAAGLEERRLTLDTGETTAWDALRLFCLKAGLSELGPPAQPGGAFAEDAIRLTDQRVETPPTHLAGAVRLRALPLGGAKSGLQGTRGFRLEASPEPGMPWQGVIGVRTTRAIDDRGQELSQPALAAGAPPLPSRPADPPVVWDALSGQPMAVPVDRRAVPVWLVAGKQPATRLREVQGRLIVQVPVPRRLLAVDNLLKAEGTTIAGAPGQSLKVLKVTRTAAALKLQVQLKRDGSAGTTFQVTKTPKGALVMRGRQSSLPIRFALHTASGAVVQPQSSRQTYLPNRGAGGLVMEFQLTFALKPGQPVPDRLVCSGPVPTLLEVPFTLRDVPLSAAAPAEQQPTANPSSPR